MPLPKFIQISSLASYPATLLNRDDSGLAKRMPFGGAIRTRISSQCLKRHWRRADDAYALTKAGDDLALAVRSRETFRRLIADPLVKEGIPPEVVEPVLTSFAKTLFESGKDKDGDKGQGDKGHKKQQKDPLVRSEVIVLGEPEIAFLLGEARKICLEADGDAKKAGGLAKDYLNPKKNKENFERFKVMGAGVDAAMFGRFMAGQPEARITNAVHVAHAMTVHPEAFETDYFSAVDDLTAEESAGSGHLGATELTSGLYFTTSIPSWTFRSSSRIWGL